MAEFQNRIDIIWNALLDPEISPIGINYTYDKDNRYVYPKINIEERVATQEQWNREWGWQTELWHEYDSPQFRELHALIFLERYNKGAKNLKKNLPGYNQDDYNKDLQFFMKKIQETPLLGE